MTTTAVRAARLVAGVHVVPRDDEHVQVGLDPPGRVLVRREAELLAALDALRRGRTVDPTPAVERLVRQLAAAGLLEDPVPAVDRGTVVVVDRGLGAGLLTRLLKARGITSPREGETPALHVVTSPGPVPRSLLDDWSYAGTPHLLLAGTGRAGSLRLGPLVEPGTTACQRCVDAAEATHDPRRSLVLEQLALRPAAPLAPSLVALGLAAAARDVTTYVGGGRPVTWSGTLDLDDPRAAPVSWRRHPHCGCSWDVLPY